LQTIELQPLRPPGAGQSPFGLFYSDLFLITGVFHPNEVTPTEDC
jgi:hypothetical protein